MNKKLLIGGIILVAAIALLIWFLLRGDKISLSITVRGETGSPIENAKVTIESASQTTDAQGSAVFPMRA